MADGGLPVPHPPPVIPPVGPPVPPMQPEAPPAKPIVHPTQNIQLGTMPQVNWSHVKPEFVGMLR